MEEQGKELALAIKPSPARKERDSNVVKPFVFVDKWFRKIIFGDKPEKNLAGRE